MPTFHTKLTYAQAADDLSKMRGMVEGWDSYGAKPPSDEALKKAGEYLRMTYERDVAVDRVSPSVIGGVGITVRKGRDDPREVYYEWDNGGRGYVMFSDRSGKYPAPDGISIHELVDQTYMIQEAVAFLHGDDATAVK